MAVDGGRKVSADAPVGTGAGGGLLRPPVVVGVAAAVLRPHPDSGGGG